MRQMFLVLLTLVSSTTIADGAEVRTWKSADGKFEVRAKLVELVENPDGKVIVVIENEEGKKSRVPLKKLSGGDTSYIEGRKDRGAGMANIRLKRVRELPVAEEGPDVNSWKFESADAKAAVKKYQAAADTQMKEREKRLNRDRRNLERAFGKALTKATKAGQLDEAIRIREAIATLGEGHVAASKGSTRRKNKAAASGGAKRYKVLGSRLKTDMKLTIGTSLQSKNKRYELAMGSDGNLRLYKLPDRIMLWASSTGGKGPVYCKMQADGNFVMLIERSGTCVWATMTHLHPRSTLLVQDNGDVVIYNLNNQPVWRTATQGR